MAESCCAPSREGGTAATESVASHAGATHGMALVPAGSVRIGSDSPAAYPADGEAPVREFDTRAYWIDARAVTNGEFASFVDATGHVTDAERFGWSFVFGGLLPDDFPETQGVAAAPWWRKVHGAHWRCPEGAQSSIESRLEHPVVHVSWNDAAAYAAWSGKRLPTETEWERAARGGLDAHDFPWGDDLEPQGEHRMNVWQGDFPSRNTLADGYLGTAPVDAFGRNGYGLYNVTGNVWEWVADWFQTTFRAHERRLDPTGPPTGTHKTQKGGSYICHHSYCRRYRVAARQASTPDSSTGNVGFRCARDA